jgi:hypothetical protein
VHNEADREDLMNVIASVKSGVHHYTPKSRRG